MLSSKHESFPSRSTAALHFHTLSLSRHARTPLNNRREMQTLRDIDIASDTASDTPAMAIARHRYDRRPWRRGRIPTTPPRRLNTRRGLIPTPPLRRDGSRSSRDTRDATTQHLLYIYCLLIKSAKNLISLLLKNRLFRNQ